jgi:hypothetical protein
MSREVEFSLRVPRITEEQCHLARKLTLRALFITFSPSFWEWNGTRILTASQAARNRELSIYRQITLPRRHRKAAARTDFTGKYGLPLSEKTEKSFGSD